MQEHGVALVLPAEPASVGRSRRYVREALRAAGRGDWVDAAELAVSELVTNAVLHAHSDVLLDVEITDAHARINVRDHNPVLPSARGYDDHATTGRGLGLIAAVALEHGVESLGGDGKIVWACIGDSPAALCEDDLLGSWDDTGEFVTEGAPATVDGMEVVLLGLPPTLWLAAREHHDALLRELVLLQGGGADVRADLTAADEARFTISTAVDAAVERARARGEASVPLPQYHPGALPAVPEVVHLPLVVPRERAEAFAALQDALDEAEALARAEQLLVQPGLPEIIGLRDWCCEQVIAQVAGSPPGRWPGADDQRFADMVDRHDLPQGWDADSVNGSKVGVIAVDQGNRIVAISEPLADVVGWARGELIGRRVVVIIPPRFREAHVAGFSRHLSTGDARALGVELILPVLRADGTEIDCRFLIQSETAAEGVVYRAWITPL